MRSRPGSGYLAVGAASTTPPWLPSWACWSQAAPTITANAAPTAGCDLARSLSRTRSWSSFGSARVNREGECLNNRIGQQLRAHALHLLFGGFARLRLQFDV